MFLNYKNSRDKKIIISSIALFFLLLIFYLYRRKKSQIKTIRAGDISGPFTKLGEGAFGIAYKCKYDGKDAVVKMIAPTSGEAESRSLVRFKDTPHIIQFYGEVRFSDESGVLRARGIVMEYAQGGSLHAYLRSWKFRSPSWQDKLKLTIQIVDGLQAVHKQGVVHQDLKSDNVLLSGTGDALLADFGIARYRRFRMTIGDRTIAAGKADQYPNGTVPYIAPEVVSGDPRHCTSKSDIFSLGVLLWEIATMKQPPFRSEDDVIKGKFTTVSDKRCKFFAPIIRDCTRFKPDDRPTAAQIKRRLEQCKRDAKTLDGEKGCVLL